MKLCPPLHLGVVAIENGAFGSPSTMVANFYFYKIQRHLHVKGHLPMLDLFFGLKISKKFLIDNSISKYIYKNMNFWKKKVDQSKFLCFFVVVLSFSTKMYTWCEGRRTVVYYWDVQISFNSLSTIGSNVWYSVNIILNLFYSFIILY